MSVNLFSMAVTITIAYMHCDLCAIHYTILLIYVLTERAPFSFKRSFGKLNDFRLNV